jgi:hypothetical protein
MKMERPIRRNPNPKSERTKVFSKINWVVTLCKKKDQGRRMLKAPTIKKKLPIMKLIAR